jgi:hypothetical protein
MWPPGAKIVGDRAVEPLRVVVLPLGQIVFGPAQGVPFQAVARLPVSAPASTRACTVTREPEQTAWWSGVPESG